MMPFSAMRMRAAAGEDPYFANVISLVHFDGADGSTTITDQIPGNTWSVNTSTISTTNPKFGVGCLAMGVGIIAGISKNADATQGFGVGEFCLEVWVRPDSLASVRYILDTRTSSQSNLMLSIRHTATGGLEVLRGTTVVISGGTLTVGVYQHIALARVSGVTRLFLDGVQAGSDYTDANNYTNTTIFLGKYVSSSGSFLGRIDEFRATKGAGRYAADFTPPTSAFPDS